MPDITLTLSRADLIVLSMLTSNRRDDVLKRCTERYTMWCNSEAGSDDARWHHKIYADDLLYANDLDRLYQKLDKATDVEPCQTEE